MKKLFLLPIAALAFMLGSCDNELDESLQNLSKLYVISAEMPNVESRTTTKELEVLWAEGDKIGVFRTESEISENYLDNCFTLSSGAGQKTASFTAERASGVDNAVAYYPYREGTSYNGEITVNLPSEQSYKVANQMLMVGQFQSGSNSIAFKNAMALAVITVKNIPEGYTKAVLTASDDEYLAGTATVTLSNPSLVISDEQASKTLTIDFGDNTDVEKRFYFAIPAGAYANGLTVTLEGEGFAPMTIGTLRDGNGQSFTPEINEFFYHNVELNAGVSAIQLITNETELENALKEGGQYQLANDIQLSKSLIVSKDVTLDLGGKTVVGTDKNTSGNFYLIDNRSSFTIKGEGTINLIAENNREWSSSSVVVANNPGGNLTIEGGVIIEHLGGTNMAYGVDNLTNGKGTVAITTINGATIKSAYRAIRQFLNGIEATNELYVKSGIIEGINKSIWMQDPSQNANTGKLEVGSESQLKGDVYLTVTAGSTAWPVEVSIAASALQDESQVLTNGNLPQGYLVAENNGIWSVANLIAEDGTYQIANLAALKWFADQVNTGSNYFAGKTVVLTNDIDLNNEEWTPIGTESDNFEGNFDGNNKVIKNLKITTHASITDEFGVWAYAGLFGVTCGASDKHNSIKNLVIENVDINCNGDNVAAAVAYPYYTDIENITVRGDVKIKGGNYTAGVLAYTRRCVNAKNLTIEANEGSTIEGKVTVGGVISDIQMNGGLIANYSNFQASGLTITAEKCVGGISGIISGQTLDGATVENVIISSENATKGTVSGALGKKSTIKNISVTNVTGATNVVGATYDDGAEVVANGDVYERKN